MRLNIESSELNEYTRKLAQLNRSAIPKAIRSALNDAAFYMKRTTLPISVKDNFAGLKAPNFFKRYTGVEKANGMDINSMQATVGFLDMGNPAARRAVQQMNEQEKGGTLQGGLQYLKDARRGNKVNGFVRTENFYDKEKIISGRSNVGRGRGTVKSKFVARAYRAVKEDKPLFLNSMRGNFVARVTSIKKSRKGQIKIKMKLIMKERTQVRIQATHFMEEAGNLSQQTIDQLYIKNAEYWIAREINRS